MDAQIQALPFDPRSLAGLSERLIVSHHANNYSGAVKRLNAIRRQLGTLDWSSAPGFVINGLKREELIAANSMFLHELYFATLGGDGQLAPGGVSVALERDFGSVERWQAEFTALAKAMGGGSGWAVLAWSPREARLVNQWASDHTQLLAGATPLLALDMYEHAYHLDYGANAGAYVDAFMRNIRWQVVSELHAAAVEAASPAFGMPAQHGLGAAAQIVDVRRAGVFAGASELIDGAVWRDPAAVATWADAIDRSRPVLVYCVFGHEVGRSTALALRARGIDARYLVGGIEAWKANGLPTQAKGESS
jgi:Fe-Mn family superoxide dismutase